VKGEVAMTGTGFANPHPGLYPNRIHDLFRRLPGFPGNLAGTSGIHQYEKNTRQNFKMYFHISHISIYMVIFLSGVTFSFI
jgi:hypothetical protein